MGGNGYEKFKYFRQNIWPEAVENINNTAIAVFEEDIFDRGEGFGSIIVKNIPVQISFTKDSSEATLTHYNEIIDNELELISEDREIIVSYGDDDGLGEGVYVQFRYDDKNIKLTPKSSNTFDISYYDISTDGEGLELPGVFNYYNYNDQDSIFTTNYNLVRYAANNNFPEDFYSWGLFVNENLLQVVGIENDLYLSTTALPTNIEDELNLILNIPLTTVYTFENGSDVGVYLSGIKRVEYFTRLTQNYYFKYDSFIEINNEFDIDENQIKDFYLKPETEESESLVPLSMFTITSSITSSRLLYSETEFNEISGIFSMQQLLIIKGIDDEPEPITKTTRSYLPLAGSLFNKKVTVSGDVNYNNKFSFRIEELVINDSTLFIDLDSYTGSITAAGFDTGYSYGLTKDSNNLVIENLQDIGNNVFTFDIVDSDFDSGTYENVSINIGGDGYFIHNNGTNVGHILVGEQFIDFITTQTTFQASIEQFDDETGVSFIIDSVEDTNITDEGYYLLVDRVIDEELEWDDLTLVFSLFTNCFVQKNNNKIFINSIAIQQIQSFPYDGSLSLYDEDWNLIAENIQVPEVLQELDDDEYIYAVQLPEPWSGPSGEGEITETFDEECKGRYNSSLSAILITLGEIPDFSSYIENDYMNNRESFDWPLFSGAVVYNEYENEEDEEIVENLGQVTFFDMVSFIQFSTEANIDWDVTKDFKVLTAPKNQWLEEEQPYYWPNESKTISLYSTFLKATGAYSYAEGYSTTASGHYSHVEGYETHASGVYSHAEGVETIARGESSHAEGKGAIARGRYSHAEGSETKADGYGSHAEGQGTIASGFGSHAEGERTQANGDWSHAEGQGTTASEPGSHAEGQNTRAISSASHAEGYNTIASGEHSHAEGFFTLANGPGSHAEGDSTTASNYYSHAEGQSTIASGEYSHAEGSGTIAFGNYSHAEGSGTTASGGYSHAEGLVTIASGEYSHAEGYVTIASGQYSHAEGQSTTASGFGSHAEGLSTIAGADHSHVGGYNNITTTTATASQIAAGKNITLTAADTCAASQFWVAGNGNGIVMHSPNGTKYKLYVLDNGSLTAIPV